MRSSAGTKQKTLMKKKAKTKKIAIPIDKSHTKITSLYGVIPSMRRVNKI